MAEVRGTAPLIIGSKPIVFTCSPNLCIKLAGKPRVEHAADSFGDYLNSLLI